MKHRLFLSMITGCMLANQASAGAMGQVMPTNDLTWLGAISAGPVWARGGETQTFYLQPQIEKTYAADKSTNTLAQGEILIGVQKNLSASWQGQLGLAATTTSNAKLQGMIWDDAQPQFDNFVYEYRVRQSRLALKGTLLLDRNFWVKPWISASVGAGFNRTSAFNNTPTIFGALPNPNFANHTTIGLTYTLGAGIQKSITNHWQAGVGYEFADWGKSELNRSLAQTLNSGITLNHLYTNGVLFNLTFVA